MTGDNSCDDSCQCMLRQRHVVARKQQAELRTSRCCCCASAAVLSAAAAAAAGAHDGAGRCISTLWLPKDGLCGLHTSFAAVSAAEWPHLRQNELITLLLPPE